MIFLIKMLNGIIGINIIIFSLIIGSIGIYLCLEKFKNIKCKKKIKRNMIYQNLILVTKINKY